MKTFKTFAFSSKDTVGQRRLTLERCEIWRTLISNQEFHLHDLERVALLCADSSANLDMRDIAAGLCPAAATYIRTSGEDHIVADDYSRPASYEIDVALSPRKACILLCPPGVSTSLIVRSLRKQGFQASSIYNVLRRFFSHLDGLGSRQSVIDLIDDEALLQRFSRLNFDNPRVLKAINAIHSYGPDFPVLVIPKVWNVSLVVSKLVIPTNCIDLTTDTDDDYSTYAALLFCHPDFLSYTGYVSLMGREPMTRLARSIEFSGQIFKMPITDFVSVSGFVPPTHPVHRLLSEPCEVSNVGVGSWGIYSVLINTRLWRRRILRLWARHNKGFLPSLFI